MPRLALSSTATAALILATLLLPTHATQGKCLMVNFEQLETSLDNVNQVVERKTKFGELQELLAPVEPLQISDTPLAPTALAALGATFVVTGLSAARVQPVNATSPQSLAMGVHLPSSQSLRVHALVHLSVAQTGRSWYAPCWTDVLHPTTCSPLLTEMEIVLDVRGASVRSDLALLMAGCPLEAAGAATTPCTDLAVADFLQAAAEGEFAPLLRRVLRRTIDASVQSVELAFDELVEYSVRFTSSSKLVQALGRMALKYDKDALNKKGAEYDQLIAKAQAAAKDAANDQLAAQYARHYGATCYD